MDTLLDADARIDKKTFYDWLDRQEGRYELEDGKIVMVRVSRGHSLIVTNFVKTLGALLDATAWNIATTEFAVEIGEQVRFPDVIVEPAGGDVRALECTQPKLLIEVLSPSSVGRDFNLKLSEYKTLPSLEAYVIASQDEPIVWIWQRPARSGDQSPPFPEKPQEIKGREQAIGIGCLGVSLFLADIYRGIGDR